MSFDTNGYLSEETKDIRSIIKSNFKSHFEICVQINTLAHRIRNSIKSNFDNELHIVSICLLQKIIDSFQSSILLLEIGLEADSNILLRSSVETMFILRKLALNPKFIKKYLGSDQLQRKKLINVIKHSNNNLLKKQFSIEELDRILEEITEDINELNLSKINIEQIAKECDMNEWYQLTYRTLSTDIHSLPRSLERYVVFSDKKEIFQFVFTPKTDRIEAVLIAFSSTLLITLDSIERIFKCGFRKEIDKYLKRIENW